MSWFKKKKEAEEAPNLSELPELPELPESVLSPAKLPSDYLPNVPAGLPEIETKPIKDTFLGYPQRAEEAEQRAIKQAIAEPVISQEYSKPSSPSSPRTMRPSIIEQLAKPSFNSEAKRTLEISPSKMPSNYPRMTKKIEPVFVRLDKFQMTIETFEDIKAKIREIEESLGKINDIKIKEEQELAEWEKEIQVIKSRIELIDRDVLNKLD